MPGLVLWGFDGFVLGRIAGVLLVLAVRVVYVRRLLPGVRVSRLALRGAAPVLGAGALVLLVRLALWGDRSAAQAGVELALFLAAAVALTWLSERDLLRELLAQVRAPGRGRMVEALGARGR
jgi:multisubunit Na+/H+ antiporter MnhB subunit